MGKAYASTVPSRAGEHLSRALNTFRELGAPGFGAGGKRTANLDRSRPERDQEQSALTQLLTLRLAEAVASRELLLRELAAVMRQETGAERVLITERGEHNEPRVLVSMGTTPAETVKIAADIGFLKTDDEVEHYCRKHDAKVILLKSSNAPSATLYLARAPEPRCQREFHLTHCYV